MAGYPARPVAERFWPKVNKRGPDECWEFTSSLLPTGYGRLGIPGRGMVGAHRVSYELHHGPIAPGLVVRHRCDNPPCVNPDHLEVGTHADNAQDRISRGRTRVTPLRGEANPKAKLTVEQVREIRSIPMRPGLNQELAERFGLNWKYISAVRNGRYWPDVQ